MRARVALRLAALAVALALVACADSGDADQAGEYDTFHSTPDKPDDGHGWGVSVQKQGGG
jgi:hypothetical protein